MDRYKRYMLNALTPEQLEQTISDIELGVLEQYDRQDDVR